MTGILNSMYHMISYINDLDPNRTYKNRAHKQNRFDEIMELN